MSDFETWWASVEYKGLYPEASHDWAEEGWNACERNFQTKLILSSGDTVSSVPTDLSALRVDEDEE